MHIITERRIERYARKHATAAAPLANWARLVRSSHWTRQDDVKLLFGASVDFLPPGVVVFDVGGNKVRISANIRWVNAVSRVGRVYIRRVMDHDEYDRRSKDGTLELNWKL